MDSKVSQCGRKDISSSIDNLLRWNIGIRKMLDDVQLSEVVTKVLDFLLDHFLTADFTFSNLTGQCFRNGADSYE
jgi:hypothetical protein